MQSALKESYGLPMGVQVIGPPYQEERVLKVMREIEEGVKFH